MYNEKMMEKRLSEASALVTRYLGLEVIVAAAHGSVLRGYNDPNSDIDLCFLVRRPVADFVCTSTSPYFDNTLEERRRKTTELSRRMSAELGWNISVSLLDMRAMLRGIMSGNSFSLLAYESFAKRSPKVKHQFEGVVEDYHCRENLAQRCGDNIRASLRTYAGIQSIGMEYKKERTFLSILWTAHRLLAYLDGDLIHGRSIQELIALNTEKWAQVLPEGFDTQVTGVIKTRIERSPFDPPRGISVSSSEYLSKFCESVLTEAANHLRQHPTNFPTIREEAAEMIDLYADLLAEEDAERLALARQEEQEAVAA